MKKFWEIVGKVVAVLIMISFALCSFWSCVHRGVEADKREQATEQTVDENKLIKATIIAVGTEYTSTLKLPILCQDRKGTLWKAEVSGLPSKGQNVILEIENDKVINIWET